jgi:hypothetical protein
VSEPADYVTLAVIKKRMGVGIHSGRKALTEMRKHPKFPKATIGGKYFWPSIADFLLIWNGLTVDAPGIAAGQENSNGQTSNTGRPRPRLAAAKERLGGRVAG